MPRFFVFGSRSTARTPNRAAYAFCVEERPDRIYWGRGTNNDSASIVREAASRILDAVATLELTSPVELITSVGDFNSRVDQAIRRDNLRKGGKTIASRHEDEQWHQFALQFRQSGVEIGDPDLHRNSHIFRRVRKEARLQLNRDDLPDVDDPYFTQRDDFDLVGDLQAIT